MEKYNVFKLFVVYSEDIYYICKKQEDKYIDIFFNDELEVYNKDDIKYLASYYMVETMEKLARGEEFLLNKKELILKFACLNASNIHKDKLNYFPQSVIEYQERYLKAFKELSEKRPEIAKQIAEDSIKKLNLRYENK